MDATLVRTSVTTDEAVAILLGWLKGPARYTSLNPHVSDEEQYELDSQRFSLADELESREITCENDLEGAKDDGLTEAVIAEKRTALKSHRELAQRAIVYHYAVHDEINKGEQSGLRVDKALSNSTYTYVTMTSLDEWAKAQYGKQILKQPESPILATVVQNKAATVPRTRMADQEDAILEEIERLGYNTKYLPQPVGSKPGVKAAVKKALAVNPLFKGKKPFDHAWDRLRNQSAIADAVLTPHLPTHK